MRKKIIKKHRAGGTSGAPRRAPAGPQSAGRKPSDGGAEVPGPARLELTTNISTSRNGRHSIRKHDLIKLIEKNSLVDVIFLLWRGTLPKAREAKLLESMLVASVEHGIEAPSLFIPRVVASTGNPMNVALAASALAVGTRHGGAIETAALLLARSETPSHLVTEYIVAKKIIPGLGHKIYKFEDPRATALYHKARQLRFKNHYFKKAYAIERIFKKVKGKHLPLNIDGAIAAGLLELGFDPRLGQAFFVIPRLIGAAAHILEEQTGGKSYHRLRK